jgi:hypothetical protein
MSEVASPLNNLCGGYADIDQDRRFMTTLRCPLFGNDPLVCYSSFHMQPTVIVWDLETVPDLGGFAAANDLIGKSDVEVREAIGDKFPKHIYHSIVASVRSLRTGRPTTGRWTPSERPTWARGQRKNS